jgi:hypothetical protein
VTSSCEHGNEFPSSIKGGKFLELSEHQLLKVSNFVTDYSADCSPCVEYFAGYESQKRVRFHDVYKVKVKVKVKVKLPLCLTKYCAMKMYWRWRCSSTYS